MDRYRNLNRQLPIRIFSRDQISTTLVGGATGRLPITSRALENESSNLHTSERQNLWTSRAQGRAPLAQAQDYAPIA